MANFLFLIIPFTLSFWHVLGGEFVVYPRDGRDVAACARTTDFLNELLFSLHVETCVIETRKVTQLWLVQAEESDVEHILKQPGVKDVLENKIISKSDGQPVEYQPVTEQSNSTQSNLTLATPYTNRRVIRQKDAPEDLAVVSWPPGKKIPKPKRGGMQGYDYDVLAGTDKYIYVIEYGINPDYRDFRYMPHKPIEWLWTPGVLATPMDHDPKAHGSCVASKAVGFINGVSKNSRLVIVKASHTMADTEWAFAKIYNDIVKKGRQKSAVILYARSSKDVYDINSQLPVYWSSIRQLMQELFVIGVHIVTSAGNDGKQSIPLNSVPAVWNEILPLIIVGAVTVQGEQADFTQGHYLDDGLLYAPGVNVQCAGGSSLSGMQTINGTSAAAGLVAGLVAYYLGKEPSVKSPADMRQYISQKSRYIVGISETSPEIVWNGERGT